MILNNAATAGKLLALKLFHARRSIIYQQLPLGEALLVGPERRHLSERLKLLYGEATPKEALDAAAEESNQIITRYLEGE